MAKSSSIGWAVAAILVILLIFGAAYGNFDIKWPGQQGAAACGTGTHVDTASGLCVPDSGGVPVVAGSKRIYSGPVDWTVTSKDGDSKAALALTNAVFYAYHRDGASYAGSATQGTSTAIRLDTTDEGQMVLCVLYKTSTVGFVDPKGTIAWNPTYLKTSWYLKDVDTDGKLDQCYGVDMRGDVNFWITEGMGPPQQNPDLIIDLTAWNSDATVTITNISAPTGMNTPGDYHHTGYIAAITSTYMMNVVRIYLNVVQSGTGAVNSTSGGLWSLLQAGSTYLMGFTLRGSGGQGGTYGDSWLANKFTSGYDTGSQTYEIFKAHDPNDATKVDITQPNYGMGFVQERLSATTWLGFDVWIKTSADLTASSKYYAYLFVVATNPAGTTTSNTLTLTWTG